MTRDDVIRMAREAGVFFSVPDVCPTEPLEHHVQAVERFADLVAAHEREECAKMAKKAIFQIPENERKSGDLLEHYICSSIRARR